MKKNIHTALPLFAHNTSAFSFKEKRVIFGGNINALKNYDDEDLQLAKQEVQVEPVTIETKKKLATVEKNMVIAEINKKTGTPMLATKPFDNCTKSNITKNASCSTQNKKQKTTEELNKIDANNIAYKKQRRDLEFKNNLFDIPENSADKYNNNEDTHWTEKPEIATTFVGEDIYITQEDIVSIFGKKDIWEDFLVDDESMNKRTINDISGYSKIITNILRYIPNTKLSKVLTKGKDGKIYLAKEGIALIKKFDKKAEYSMNQSTAELTAHMKDVVKESFNLTPEEKRRFEMLSDADLSGKLVDGNATNTHVEGVKFLGMTVGQEVKETYDTVRNKPITDIDKALEPEVYNIFNAASTWGNDGQTLAEYQLVRQYFIDSEKALLNKEHDENNWFTNWMTDNALDYEGSLQEAKLVSRGVARFVKDIDVNNNEEKIAAMVDFGRTLAGLTTAADKLNAENKQIGKFEKLTALNLAHVNNATKALLSPINSPCTEGFTAEVKKNGWEVNVVVENLFVTGLGDKPKDTTVITRFDQQETRSTKYGEWEETSRNVLSQDQVFREMPATVLNTVVNTVIGNPYTISDTSETIAGNINTTTTSSVIGTDTERVLGNTTTTQTQNTTVGDRRLVDSQSRTVQGATSTESLHTKNEHITITSRTDTTTTDNTYNQDRTTTTTNHNSQEYTDTTKNTVQTIRVGNQDVCTVRTVVTGQDTTVTTVENIKTGEIIEITTTMVNGKRVVTETVVKTGKEKIVKTKYKANRPHIKYKIYAGKTATQSAQGNNALGCYKFTTNEGIRANILNPVDMTISAGANYEQQIGDTGFSTILGAGISANAERQSITHNASYGLKYENGPFQMSLQKNIQYFNTITGQQDIASYTAKASLDVGEVNLFVSAQAGDDKDISSVSAGIERNSTYYTKKLQEMYNSVVQNETDQILTDLNARRAKIGKPPVGTDSMLLKELQMAKAGANLIDAMRGSLHNIGATLSPQGLSILMGFVTDITVFKRVTGLDPRQFARVESFMFEAIENGKKINGRLTSPIKLSEITRSNTELKGKGKYNPYPASIAKKYVGTSAGSAYSSPKIIIHGEKNIKIHEDGSMSFLPGVIPHPPFVSERMMADGTIQIEINYGHDYLSSSLAYTEEILGEFDISGGFRKLDKKILNAEELEYNKQILAELEKRGHVTHGEVINMRGLTKAVLLEQKPGRAQKILVSPASTKRVKLTDGTTKIVNTPAQYTEYNNEAVESLAILPENQEQVMSEINALTYSLLKNKKLGEWSTEFENYFTENLSIDSFTNSTKREEIKSYIKQKFQEKNIPLSRNLEQKPLLVYLAIERARMQRDNRKYDKNGNFLDFKKTAQQKEKYAHKGDFNTLLTKEFGNENGGKFTLGNETISFTDGTIGFGVVQGRKAKPVFMPTFAGMTFKNARTWKGEYQGHTGTYFDASDPDCLNGTRGFIPDKEGFKTPATSYTETTPATYTTQTTPAVYKEKIDTTVTGGRIMANQASHNDFSAVVDAMQIGLGATVGRYSFTSTVTETIKEYREVEVDSHVETRSQIKTEDKFIKDVIHDETTKETTTDVSTDITKGPVKNVEVSREVSSEDVVVDTHSGVINTTSEGETKVETIVTHDSTVDTNTVKEETRTPIIITEPKPPVIPVPPTPVEPTTKDHYVPVQPTPADTPLAQTPTILEQSTIVPTDPLNPTTVQPVQPTTAQPVQPTTVQPVQPTTAQPVQPTTAQPVQPTPAQPAPPPVTLPIAP